MTQQQPKITTFNPVVLSDKRRVTLEMVVDNLPAVFSNVSFMMMDTLDSPPVPPSKPNPDAPSPYPNIELSILNSNRRPVASLLIVEHNEKYTTLTLHIRKPNPSEKYTARAEMTYQESILDVVEVPFTLNHE